MTARIGQKAGFGPANTFLKRLSRLFGFSHGYDSLRTMFFDPFYVRPLKNRQSLQIPFNQGIDGTLCSLICGGELSTSHQRQNFMRTELTVPVPNDRTIVHFMPFWEIVRIASRNCRSL